MKRHHFMIGSIALLCIIIPSFLIYQILKFQDSQIQAIKNIILQEAKSHFENVVITRKWNAQYGGIYVRKSDNIEPNPYLKQNHIFDDQGNMLVKINPAWMTRQISEISNELRDYYFKITSLNPLNPNNKADAFETRGLQYFEKNRNKKYYYEEDETQKSFNLIGALEVEQECLYCHAVQNYKLGDIRGGIRVSIPTVSHSAKINKIKTNTLISIITIIALTIIIAITLIRSILIIVHQNKKYLELNESLEKRIAQEIVKNQQKEKMLSQQSKLAALGEMLNNIAHQWRQPLSTITTATSGMQLEKEMGILNDDEFNKNTNLILEQANHMSRTIDDFKNFFKKDKSKIRFNLKEIILKDIELVKSSYSGENITIDTSTINDNISLYGYPNELSQALLNILNNAKDQFSKIGLESKIIQITTQIQNNTIELHICDNAGGVPEDIIDKIFDPYFTTKHQSHGTGIGLYMTRQIIVDHLNGSIHVENKILNIKNVVYEGACFIISLPISSEIE